MGMKGVPVRSTLSDALASRLAYLSRTGDATDYTRKGSLRQRASDLAVQICAATCLTLDQLLPFDK